MSTVRLAVEDGVATLTLAGDNKLNTFDLQMRDALIEAVGAVADDPAARVVVLCAEGPHFSAGADLREFGGAADLFEARWIRDRRDPWLPLWKLARPTIASLRGVTMGSGLEMALLCDVRVAEPDVRLALPETKLGMLPAACGTQSLPRAIGAAAALPLVLSGRELDAAEALELGILNVVSDDAAAEAGRLARRLADRPAAAATAAALRGAAELPLAAGLALEKRLAIGLHLA